jgi:flagellar FliL protein
MSKGGMFEKIAAGIAILVSLLTIGVFAYTNILYKAPSSDDASELEDMKRNIRGLQIANSIHIKKIIINLPSNRKRLRFLDMSVSFIPFKNNQIEFLESRKAILNDALIDIASNMEPTELNTIAGKIIFESRVKNKINKSFKKPYIRDLLFSKFVIQ